MGEVYVLYCTCKRQWRLNKHPLRLGLQKMMVVRKCYVTRRYRICCANNVWK
jgi:hypothetical protein